MDADVAMETHLRELPECIGAASKDHALAAGKGSRHLAANPPPSPEPLRREACKKC